MYNYARFVRRKFYSRLLDPPSSIMVVSVLRFLTLLVALSLALSSLRHTEANAKMRIFPQKRTLTRYSDTNVNVS